MLTKTDYEKFSKEAEKYLAKAGIVITEEERKNIEVADFCVGPRGAINAMPYIYQI